MSLSKEKECSPNGSSSTLPLLADDEDYEDAGHTVVRKKARFPISAFVVHAVVFCAYTIAFLAYAKTVRGENCHKSMVYSPARDAIKWEKTAFQNELGQENPFKGHPRPELDQAWHDLLENSNIRVSEETLQKINRTSIKLADGSGDYLAGLNVHHHLHCLKSIRRVIYRDYYDLYEDDEMWIHLEHCMDDLRQAIMCNADFTLLTYDWLPNYRKPWPNFNVDYECVNWKMLDDWAGERAFSLFDQKSLVHPQLGLAFPRVNGSIDFGVGIHPHVDYDGEGGTTEGGAEAVAEEEHDHHAGHEGHHEAPADHHEAHADHQGHQGH